MLPAMAIFAMRRAREHARVAACHVPDYRRCSLTLPLLIFATMPPIRLITGRRHHRRFFHHIRYRFRLDLHIADAHNAPLPYGALYAAVNV